MPSFDTRDDHPRSDPECGARRGGCGAGPRDGRAAAVALCLVSLLVTVLFLTALGRNGELAFVTMPPSLRASLALAPLVGVLAVATVAGSALAWVDGYWSRRARLHQTLLAVLELAFAWQLFRFGLMGL